MLLTAEGEPRLTDFGLAKVGRADQNLSMTGQVLGTPAYMAPEQAAGKVHEVGTAADVYALGAVLYDLLTGRPPFKGDSAAVTLQKVLTEEPTAPAEAEPGRSRADLETICLKCLEKASRQALPHRPGSCRRSAALPRNEPISVRPTVGGERGYKWVKRNKVVAGAPAVFLTLVVGTGVSVGFGLEAEEAGRGSDPKAKEGRRGGRTTTEETQRADRERADAIFGSQRPQAGER